MIAVVTLAFILFHAVPADPARLILGPNAPESQVVALQKELGLDQPLTVQFLSHVKGLLRLEFGRSYVDKRPVFQEVFSSFRISLLLIIVSMTLTTFYCAVTLIFLNHPPSSLNTLLVSSPTFFSGIFIALLSVRFYPYSSFSGSLRLVEDFFFFFPPAFALAVYPMGVLSNLLIVEMNRTMKSKFIMAARAYSIPDDMLIFKYALRNAINPILAALSNQLPALFTSAFILEIIFSIPGTGSLLVKSIFARDFPMIEGVIILSGSVFFLINIFFEIIYPLIDPRVKST